VPARKQLDVDPYGVEGILGRKTEMACRMARSLIGPLEEDDQVEGTNQGMVEMTTVVATRHQAMDIREGLKMHLDLPSTRGCARRVPTRKPPPRH
jgi:hypothetical protein